LRSPFELQAERQVRVARAIFAVSKILKSLDESTFRRLPLDARDGVARYRKALCGLIERWGMQRAAQPDGDRFIEEQNQHFLQDIRKLFLINALSYVNGLVQRGEEVPEKPRKYAKIAEEEGLSPESVPFEQAASNVQALYEQYYHLPIGGLGAVWPGTTDDEWEKLCHGQSLIDLAIDELKRRIGVQEAAIGSDAAASVPTSTTPPAHLGATEETQGPGGSAGPAFPAATVPPDHAPHLTNSDDPRKNDAWGRPIGTARPGMLGEYRNPNGAEIGIKLPTGEKVHIFRPTESLFRSLEEIEGPLLQSEVADPHSAYRMALARIIERCSDMVVLAPSVGPQHAELLGGILSIWDPLSDRAQYFRAQAKQWAAAIGIELADMSWASDRPATGTATQSTGGSVGSARMSEGKQSSQVRKPRKRRRKGDAEKLLASALRSLADGGQWEKTDREIIRLAGISPDSFYRLTGETGSLRPAMEEYRRRSLGRGPARADEV
jgi:hypothetical protein